MSLTNKFSQLTVDPKPQTPGQNTDIDAEVSGIPTPSQNKTADQKSKQSKKDKEVFTFVTVYYKPGDWSARVYHTLREGLLELVEECCDSLAEQERLVSMDDDELLYNILIMGKECIDEQIGHGLVGVVKGPNHIPTDLNEPTVYLEVYYKHGEWELREGCSHLIEEAMEDLASKIGTDEWNELSAEEQMEAALEQNEEDVREQNGWGVVTRIAGSIHARL